MDDSVIRFEGVRMRYGEGPEVLHGLSFALAPASFHYLTGASGAGKTTLLKLMYLAQRATGGEVRLFGHGVSALARDELPGLRRRIGVVFQDFSLLDHLSAFDNVALPLRVSGMTAAEIGRRVSAILAWVGLADHMQAKPPTLSGGQKQRVAIARAVIGQPDLLLADEPTGSVDDRIARRLMYLFEELNRQGTTVVIATHSHALIREFPHPHYHLEGGRLRLVARGDLMAEAAAPSPEAAP